MNVLKWVFAVVAIAIAAQANAAGFPERNITMIVPFPAGGASDMAARMVVAKLSERLGQTIIIDNRAGANGAIGATALKQAKPDGYTLLIGSIGVFAINPALFKDLKYDPPNDFDLLSVLVRTPNVLVANPDFPASSVAELMEYLKKNPDKITFASSGSGSSDHLTAALFWQKTGTTGLQCAVSRRRAGDQRSRGRPRQCIVPESRRRRPADKVRQAKGAGDHQRQARSRSAAGADDGGSGRSRS
jgi:tripartite-type tricarboxylate transporter receptor subunit TctC